MGTHNGIPLSSSTINNLQESDVRKKSQAKVILSSDHPWIAVCFSVA